MEACGLELRKGERGVVRPRGDGALGRSVVFRGGDGTDGGSVAVPRIEDGTGYVGPAPRGAGTRAAVGAVCGMGA